MDQQTFYEADEQVSQYCEFHYGREYLGVANYPSACVKEALALMGDCRKKRALDIGCAVGRSSFELAREFKHVHSIDYSHAFIEVAQHLQTAGSVNYQLVQEGTITTKETIALEALGLAAVREKVTFSQGDACALPDTCTGYDLITAFNLICRLADPHAFLDKLHTRLNPGGILILTTPCTWLETFTPKDKWLGGYSKDGQDIYTQAGLDALLSPHFHRLGEPQDMAFVIRETRRKYQHTFAEWTAWKLR